MSHFRITQVEVCTGLDHFVHSNLKFKAALRKQQTSSELLLKLSPSPALIQKISYILCSWKKTSFNWSLSTNPTNLSHYSLKNVIGAMCISTSFKSCKRINESLVIKPIALCVSCSNDLSSNVRVNRFRISSDHSWILSAFERKPERNKRYFQHNKSNVFV